MTLIEGVLLVYSAVALLIAAGFVIEEDDSLPIALLTGAFWPVFGLMFLFAAIRMLLEPKR